MRPQACTIIIYVTFRVFHGWLIISQRFWLAEVLGLEDVLPFFVPTIDPEETAGPISTKFGMEGPYLSRFWLTEAIFYIPPLSRVTGTPWDTPEGSRGARNSAQGWNIKNRLG